eukprot:9605055-Alexandrium_andersonii.AAC.1
MHLRIHAPMHPCTHAPAHSRIARARACAHGSSAHAQGKPSCRAIRNGSRSHPLFGRITVPGLFSDRLPESRLTQPQFRPAHPWRWPRGRSVRSCWPRGRRWPRQRGLATSSQHNISCRTSWWRRKQPPFMHQGKRETGVGNHPQHSTEMLGNPFSLRHVAA